MFYPSYLLGEDSANINDSAIILSLEYCSFNDYICPLQSGMANLALPWVCYISVDLIE